MFQITGPSGPRLKSLSSIPHELNSSMHITSRDNALLKQVRAVRDGKTDDLIFVEGLRLCEEALLSKLTIEAVIYSEELARKGKASQVIEDLSSIAKRTVSVNENLLGSISYTKTPQGIVLLAKRPPSGPKILSTKRGGSSLVVVMHRINNPVNVGAILRTAEASGADGAIATSDTSDPFSPKSLRGAMGSAFRIPIWFGPAYKDVIAWCRENKLASLCADGEGARSYTEVDWKRNVALILGPESTGLSTEELAAADQTVRIPMSGPVESLNVSVAAGILLFEAARQRSAG